MAADGGGDALAKLPIDYEFDFVIRNYKAVEKDSLVNRFSHDEDCWQLEMKRVVEGNNKSQSDFNCKLRLIRSYSEWKIAGISGQIGCKDKGVGKQKVKKMATLFRSGWEFNIGTVHVDLYDLKMIHVEVLKFTVADPNPTRDIDLPLSELSAEMRKWFQSEDFGDATIVAADGVKLRCHRDVLARRCEVLDLMFCYAMKNSGQNVINIKNFDGKIISQLLMFLYSGECDEMSSPHAYDLFVAADEYQLDQLKNLCESALADSLNDEDVMKTLQLADHYHLEDLVAKCVDHLAVHRCGMPKPSKAEELPQAKRSRYADPKGLTITSTKTNSYGYGRRYSEDIAKEFPIDYKFAVTFSNRNSLEVGEVVFSDSFTVNGDLWQLQLAKYDRNDVWCKLHLVDTSNEEFKMACVGRTVVKSYGYGDYDDDNDASPERTTETKSTRVALFQHSGDSFDFGTLTIGSNFNAAQLKVLLVKWQFAQSEHEPQNLPMASEFLKWFDTEDFGDLTVVAKDGKKFRCHRDILARRCEVLKQKINSTMEEAVKYEVNKETDEHSKSQMPAEELHIEDFEEDIVAQLLLFLYSDECGKIGPIADRLWFAARHYRLERLQNLCESALVANLSTKSFVKFYRLATTYHLDKLLAVCVDFLKTHKAVLPVEEIVAEAIKMEEEPKGKRPRLE